MVTSCHDRDYDNDYDDYENVWVIITCEWEVVEPAAPWNGNYDDDEEDEDDVDGDDGEDDDDDGNDDITCEWEVVGLAAPWNGRQRRRAQSPLKKRN